MRQVRLRLNEGMHIGGVGVSIDVIVRSVGGTKRHREAILELWGVPGISSLHIKPSDGSYWLDSSIEIGIRSDAKNPSKCNQVPMYFKAPGCYQFKRKFYS